jgi:Phosphatidate cytidylyltransferase, mitochondrial
MIPRGRRVPFSPSTIRSSFSRIPYTSRHYSIPTSPPPSPPPPPGKKQSSSKPIQFPKYNEKTYVADLKKFSQLPVNFGANQHISIDDKLKEKLRGVLWKFNAPIRYAFAYGSGVFQQADADRQTVFPPPFPQRTSVDVDANGRFYFRSFAYATLAWIEFGAASASLFGYEVFRQWCD